MSNEQSTNWIPTTATVTSCTYRTSPLRAMAFGIPSTANFRITFDYYAHGRLYSDEFQSPTAIPQNEQIPITYNPLAPEQNSRSKHSSATPGQTKPPILAIGIAGSIILSLAWLAVLRSCH
jgi:hypothetical protein